MSPTRYLIAAVLLLFSNISFAQVKLYESTFNGGVVGGGYSIGATIPSGSGSFGVTIPGGSTIRRAYLIGARVGPAPDVTVTLNGAPFTFSATNNITTGFNTIYGGISGVHAIDITGSISPATSAYTIAVPAQSTVSNKYTEFYLYIAFDNASMPVVSSAIFLNTANLNTSSYSWTLNTATPVLNANPVGFAILGGYAAVGDCENVNVNGTAIGSFGGQDFNGASSWGCMAGFQYYNNALAGYGDDNANQAINGTDALSNIQAVLPASTNSIPVTFSHCNGGSDNHVWAVFLSWAGVILGPNDFDFGARAENDHIFLSWNAHGADMVGNYQIERSNGNDAFEWLADVTADQLTEYSYQDLNPYIGRNLYRIHYQDREGSQFYSEIREVSFNGEPFAWAQIAPNPIQEGQALHLEMAFPQEVMWTVISLTDGKACLAGKVSNLSEAQIPTQSLAPGAYALSLKAGAQTQQLRFMVVQ